MLTHEEKMKRVAEIAKTCMNKLHKDPEITQQDINTLIEKKIEAAKFEG